MVTLAAVVVALTLSACWGHHKFLATDLSGSSGLCPADGMSKQASTLGDGQWSLQVAAGGGDVGMFASLAFDPLDNPGISYHDQTKGELWFAQRIAGNWDLRYVDSQGPPGAVIDPVCGTSLAYDPSGNPAISYYSHWLNPHLKLARRAESGWTSEVVDPADGVGTHSSLAFDSAGNPAIGYYDWVNADLKFAWWNGAAWQIQRVDTQGYVGTFTSLAFDQNGNPAISYTDATNWALNLARGTWNQHTGSWDWETETIPDYEPVIGFTSLAFRSQDTIPFAYMSYTVESGGFALGMEPPETNPDAYALGSESATHGLRFAYQRADGWHVDIVDDSGDFEWTSLAFDADGDPAIAYYDYTDGDLKFVYDGVYDDSLGRYLWQYETVDTEGDVGAWASLAIDSTGKPGAAYYEHVDDYTGNLKFAERELPGWRTLTIDSHGAVGYGSSLAVVSGYPAISYCDQTDLGSNFGLKYVRANAADGSSWGTPVTVDSAAGPIDGSSLAVVNGNPAISYKGDVDLKYVRANDATGSSWATPTAIDATGIMGDRTSLAVVNGNPAITYYDGSNGYLMYVRATDPDGTTWGTPVAVDISADVGSSSSLEVVNGNPAISYSDSTNANLKYVRADDPNGTSWGTPVTVDSAGDVGSSTSLAVVNGNPAISYSDWGNNDLKYVRANDPGGSSWGTPVTVDSAGDVGSSTSLAVVNGSPAISYLGWVEHQIPSGQLKYVRASDAYGLSWGNPVIIDEPNPGGATSLAVVNGNAAISYCDAWYGDLKYAYCY